MCSIENISMGTIQSSHSSAPTSSWSSPSSSYQLFYSHCSCAILSASSHQHQLSLSSSTSLVAIYLLVKVSSTDYIMDIIYIISTICIISIWMMNISKIFRSSTSSGVVYRYLIVLYYEVDCMHHIIVDDGIFIVIVLYHIHHLYHLCFNHSIDWSIIV